MKKIVIFSFLLPIIAFVFLFVFKNYLPITGAAVEPNVLHGWLWSSNIGWISLNCDHTNDGTNPAYTECGSSGNPPQYQVTLNPFSGAFSGYAWNGNGPGARAGIGWIRFDPPGPYPENPQIPATLKQLASGRFQVQGWARACAPAQDPVACSGYANPVSQNTGGWDGWIKLSGSTTDCPALKDYSPNPPGKPYETCLTADGKKLEGWAWGGDTIGWIEFDPSLNSVAVPVGSSHICEVRPGSTKCAK